MVSNSWSVSKLTTYIKNLLENDWQLHDVWVKGEISNFTHHRSGHMYFSIKDDKSIVRSIMFAGNNRSIMFIPKNGMSVLVKGYVSLYERDGQYQFYVQEMYPDGIGNLYIAFQQCKERLFNEGLFDDKYKRKLPYIPKGIAVITSPTGAALRDILTTLKRRNPYIPIYVIPTLVQGEPAPREIIDAIDFVETCCQDVIDVIILARGGGSIEELWAFNNEQVARKIFNSSIPIIVGVGHETDTTIADYVADVRAATPTGAAEIVVPSITDIEKLLAILNYRMASAVQKKIEQKRHKIQRVQQLLVCYNPREELLAKQHILQKINLQLQQAITNKLVDVANSFTLFNQRLDDLNPLKIMGRGYSLVYKDEASNEASNEVKHQLVTSIKQVSKNDQLRIQLTDGMINCQVWGLKDGQEN